VESKEGKLLAGHSVEAQIVVMARDIEILDERLREIESSVDKLEPLIELTPQLKDMLESHRRIRWLLKAIGTFFAGAATMAVIAKGLSEMVDWWRGH
jgi:hypothetical protein